MERRLGVILDDKGSKILPATSSHRRAGRNLALNHRTRTHTTVRLEANQTGLLVGIGTFMETREGMQSLQMEDRASD